MTSDAIETQHSTAKRLTVWRWISFTLLLAIACYLWVVPLFRPRGDFLWGYYRLKDVYAGIPVGCALLGAIAVWASPSKYRRVLALRLVSLLVSVIVTVAVVDVVYALFVQGAWRPNYWLDQAHIPRTYNTADDELGFVRKPNLSWRGFIREANRVVDYRTDKNGFRNPSIEQATADVVFIGDSFTEAVEVNENDTFVRRVGAATGLTVVNLGRGGYSPQQELIVLEKYGLSYKPRYVVWQLFEGNDLVEADNFAAWKKNPQQQNSSLKDRYFDHSLLTKLLTKTRIMDRSVAWITLHYSDGTRARTPLHYFYESNQPAEMPLAMAEINEAIGKGYRLCQSQRIQLLLIFVPTMIRVMEPFVTAEREEDELRYLRKSTDKKDFSGLTDELCAQLGCTFVDSFAALRQAAETDNRNLYIPRDEHLDVRGHEVIAKIVVNWIHHSGGDK